ncbi:23S rRNA m(5)U-747 methyltransferase [Ruaniaceae bacterium KH17]|nr:23S rRNA m(5)U-747 methyltransferase [Ruaniaceae bacterium KH17]
MLCDYYDAGVCVSCTQLPVPYQWQLAQAQAECRATLLTVPDWAEPVASEPFHFRNKAKLAIAGTTADPTLGILDGERRGIDLRHCPLHEGGIERAIPTFAEFITRTGLIPYDVPRRRGELKFIIATISPDGDLMVRFVLRSEEHIEAIRAELPWLQERLPNLAMVSVNLHPEHKAVLEGDTEILLTEQATLPMRLGGLTLHLHPRSFFQTNTTVAEALYAQARDWLGDAEGPIWDLYCGVGGFALSLVERRQKAEVETMASEGFDSTPLRSTNGVVGVEISADAIESARRSAAEAGIDAEFIAADAGVWAMSQTNLPNAVVVNPPRRGIGELAEWLENSGIERVLYSSCNPASLARDLAKMPSLRPTRGRLFDMFPHTPHSEVMVDLRRTASMSALTQPGYQDSAERKRHVHGSHDEQRDKAIH